VGIDLIDSMDKGIGGSLLLDFKTLRHLKGEARKNIYKCQ